MLFPQTWRQLCDPGSGVPYRDIYVEAATSGAHLPEDQQGSNG
jgi:hypothetical protein